MDQEKHMDQFFINSEEAALVILDMQERLAAAMKTRRQTVDNCLHLIETARLFQIPILVTEQYPKGLGPTLPEIREALPDYVPFEKLSFNCTQETGFLEKVASMGRKKLLLTGMEAHICVLQTSLGLMRQGYTVQVIKDAVCSRTKNNFNTGIDFLSQAGAVITCTETVLFQLLQKAGTEVFKTIVKRIK
jgi:nicotinamidase-related amidase